MLFPNLSIVLPTKNEAEGIERVLESLKPYSDDIIVVDGHSNDGTREIAEKCGVRFVLDNQRGYGDAIKVGIKEARRDILVFFVGDGSNEPKDIPNLIQPILDKRADLVIGSRRKGGSEDVEISLTGMIRAGGCDILTLILNYRWKVNLTDGINGYKAIRREVALSLGLTSDDFVIEQEEVIKCLKKGYKILEIPTHEYARGWGSSKLQTIMGIKFFFYMIRDVIFP